MEINAEKTPVTFESSLLLAPNTLISIAELPYKLLIRSLTDYNDRTDVYEYEAVAYSVITVLVPRFAYQGKESHRMDVHRFQCVCLGDCKPYESAVTVTDDNKTVHDDLRTLGINAAWKLIRPTGENMYTIGYYTPPEKWPTEWTTPVKDTGPYCPATLRTGGNDY